MLQFTLGVITGVGLTVTGCIYLLSIKSNRKRRGEDDESTQVDLLSAGAEAQILEEVLRSLETIGVGTVEATTTSELEKRDLEEVFTHSIKQVKMRLKEVASCQNFMIELSRAYSGCAKDLARLSAIAVKHKRDSEGEDRDCGNRWHSAAVFCSSLGQDLDSVTQLSAGLNTVLAKLHEESILLERRLVNEGNKVLTKAKDCQAVLEARGKDRDAAIRKRDATSKEQLLERRLEKIVDAEENLAEAKNALQAAQEELNHYMPRVSQDLKAIVNRCVSDLTLSFAQLAAKTSGLFVAGSKAATLWQEQVTRASASMSDDHNDLLVKVLHNLKGSSLNLDMDLKSEKTAALAASGISNLLPHGLTLKGSESCVFLNAFIGRVYRDAAQSSEFHSWCCSRGSNALNKAVSNQKGSLGDFSKVQFTVTKVDFGSSSPVVSEAVWQPSPFPTQDSAKVEVEVQANIVHTSGIRFHIETEVGVLGTTILVRLQIQVSDLRGTVRFGCTRSASFLTFVEPPHILVTAATEVGDNWSFKDINFLSDLVVARVRKTIRTRLVHPNRHFFRLIWPRSWWPDDIQSLFPPLTTNSAMSPTLSTPNVACTQSPSTPQSSSVRPRGGGGGGGDDKSVSKPEGESTNKAEDNSPSGLKAKFSGWARRAGQSKIGEKLKEGLAKARNGLTRSGHNQSLSLQGDQRNGTGRGVGEEEVQDEVVVEEEEGEFAANE